MEVAEKADRATVATQMRQDPHRSGLGDPLGGRWVAVFVEGAEIAAVEDDVLGVLAAEHGVWLSSRRDEDRARRQYDLLARTLVGLRPMPADFRRTMAGQAQGGGLPEEVDLDLGRGQQFGEADPL